MYWCANDSYIWYMDVEVAAESINEVSRTSKSVQLVLII